MSISKMNIDMNELNIY